MAGNASRNARKRSVSVVLASVPTMASVTAPRSPPRSAPTASRGREGQTPVATSRQVLAAEVLRTGAYVCLAVPDAARRHLASAPIPALAARLGLRNEFEPGGGHPGEAVALLRRVGATP